MTAHKKINGKGGTIGIGPMAGSQMDDETKGHQESTTKVDGSNAKFGGNYDSERVRLRDL